MRFQISLPDDLVALLDQLAANDHRDPKRQAEWLLRRAIKHAAQDTTSQRALVPDAEEPDHATAAAP